MNDNLTKIEIDILDKLYSKEHELNFDIKLNSLIFELKGDANPNQEVGFYLERLKRLNYLDYKEKALSRGGQGDNIYQSNVINIWWDDIHISYKGKKYVAEKRLTVLDKVRGSSLQFAKDVLMEIRSRVISHLVTFLFGIVVSYCYYLIFMK